MPRTIVVVAEHFRGRLQPISYELVACAQKIRLTHPYEIKVIILGETVAPLAEEIASATGLDVLGIQAPELASYSNELYRKILKTLLVEQQAAYVCAAHTAQGLDFAPATAVDLQAVCITGVEDVDDQDGQLNFVRSMIGGKIAARACPLGEPVVLTVHPGFFQSAEQSASSAGRIDIRDTACRLRLTRVGAIKPSGADTSGITEANVIVAAGQGIAEKENLELIEQLAAIFPRSAVAGSRIVCDRGWLEYQCQVGVTGATVTPDLYVACGISGATQHVSGMRGSGFIVAINSDPAAAIFNLADVCIVEDLKTFIPVFLEKYQQTKKETQND
jgi:electron transfer flavoprotein alpha subunit